MSYRELPIVKERMMQVTEAVDILWESVHQGVHAPEALQGKLTLDEAYRVQLGMLARTVAAGKQQAGWKIGLSAAAIRRLYQRDEPVFGYLLTRDGYPSGHRVACQGIANVAIEAELCMTLGETLRGPGVTRERALAAVASITPAFEIVSLRVNMAADLALGVADNVAQWGYVTSTAIVPYPRDLVLGEVIATVLTNGNTVATLRGAEVIDDQLQSLAWLANQLAVYGVALEAGQQVITGSFNKPLPVKKGEHWEAHFSSLGSVSVAFA
jgi:2-keto-4-pentenoate hydratase